MLSLHSIKYRSHLDCILLLINSQIIVFSRWKKKIYRHLCLPTYKRFDVLRRRNLEILTPCMNFIYKKLLLMSSGIINIDISKNINNFWFGLFIFIINLHHSSLNNIIYWKGQAMMGLRSNKNIHSTRKLGFVKWLAWVHKSALWCLFQCQLGYNGGHITGHNILKYTWLECSWA